MSGEQATQTYGHGATPVAGVTYQPDVVFVQGGAAGIRGASADGLVWTIDRNAGGASDLAVGKVMLLTSRAVGRVVEIRDEGDRRVVTIAPADLGEIIRDGSFTIDQAIDLDAMGYQHIPALPAQMSVSDDSVEGSPSPSSGTQSGPRLAQAGVWDVKLPTVRLRGRTDQQEPSDDQLPPALQPRQCLEVAVGPWSTKPCAEKGRVAIAIDYKAGALGGPWKPGLKVGVVLAIRSVDLRMRSSLSISGGQTTGTTAVLEGLRGVDIEVGGGAANGMSDNDKVKVEVPIEIDLPLPASSTMGVPLNVKIEFKYIVETAFSTKNGNLTAQGRYALNGPLGLENGTFVTPTFSVESPMIDSIAGINIGVAGFILVVKMKVQFGLGVPAATAGPYISLTTSVGVALGSALGLLPCRSVTVDLKGGVGFGISITSDALKELLGKLPTSGKIKTETEKVWSIFHGEQASPPACG